MTANERAEMLVEIIWVAKKKPGKAYPRKSEWKKPIAAAILSAESRGRLVGLEESAVVAEECHPALHCQPWVDAQRNIASAIRLRGRGQK